MGKSLSLKYKIIFALFVVVLFRIGSMFPVPFVDTSILQVSMESVGSTMFGLFNMMSGGGLSQASIFAMGVSPYINASIIVQLLTVAIPALERMKKEGADGAKKINRITRYCSIVLALVQSAGFYTMLSSWGALTHNSILPAIIIVTAFSAGSLLTMWMGERITEYGVGNGISIILVSGIVSGIPSGITMLLGIDPPYWVGVILLVILAAIFFITFVNGAEKKIPVQYSRSMPGKAGMQKSHIPLKVNLSGVMPIIFASTVLSIPNTIMMFAPGLADNGMWSRIVSWFSMTSPVYAVLYVCLIVLFNVFYVSIQYDPVEMANNIKSQGGVIPGIRPGQPTAQYIRHTIKGLTIAGAVFLGIIAVVPVVLNMVFEGANFYLGGTSLLILVSVATETVKQMDASKTYSKYAKLL